MIQTREQIRCHVRWLIRRDTDEVNAIERSLALPMSEEDRLAALRSRNVIGMVAEHGMQVVGFFIYEMHKSKLEIVRLAVHPEFRRRGVGTQMLARLYSKLSSHRRTRIVATVPESELNVLQLLRSAGYLATRTVRGYFGEGEDGIRMVRRMEAES